MDMVAVKKRAIERTIGSLLVPNMLDLLMLGRPKNEDLDELCLL